MDDQASVLFPGFNYFCLSKNFVSFGTGKYLDRNNCSCCVTIRNTDSACLGNSIEADNA